MAPHNRGSSPSPTELWCASSLHQNPWKLADGRCYMEPRRIWPTPAFNKMLSEYLRCVILKYLKWCEGEDILWAICWSLGQKWQRILSISFSIQCSIAVGNWWGNSGIALGKLMMRTIALPIKGLLIFCVSNCFNIRAFLGQWRVNVAP